MRNVLVYAFGLFMMAFLFFLLFPVLLVWPTLPWRARIATLYARWLSRSILWAAGVRLRVQGEQHLHTLPAVITFNHVNMLDFFICASITPRRRCLVWGKRELGRVPFLGWIWLVSGHPLIRRKDRAQWQVLMDWVEAKLTSGR